MQQRNSVEIQAVSVDEAVRLALAELALTHDEADIEILSDAGPDEDAEALVRVTRKGQASQPVQGSAGRAPGGSGARRADDRPERGGRSRGGQGGQSGNWLAGRSGPGDRPSQRGNPPKREVVDRDDTEEEGIAKGIVTDLLRHIGVSAEVVAVDNPSTVPPDEVEPPTIFLDIIGHDLGMLIGRRGEHLSHIQYLASMLVNQQLEEWTRIIVDVEGYRTRREESLVGLAERVARQVARSNRSIELEPMPPNERRIIHLTLREYPDVTTHSTGDGNQRRITVTPNA